MNKEYTKWMVCVQCMTYNHAEFIEDTMNGFVMQQTDFPYVCCIIDDASTDGEPVIIQNYLQKYFNQKNHIYRSEDTDDYTMTFAQHNTNSNCFFAVFFLKYNHYSIRKRKMTYISKLIGNPRYIAICEGDDYWISSRKLQMQLDYMENHQDCSMTCSRAKLFSSSKNKFFGEQFCAMSDGCLNPADIINRTGRYIPTCSIMYRPFLKDNYPDYCRNCNVGDYPLQIMAAMKGKVYYFNEALCVYRKQVKSSWSSRQKFGTMNPDRLHIVSGQTKMFEGFSKDYPLYERVFKDKIAEHLCRNMPRWKRDKNEVKSYIDLFSDEFAMFTFKWRIFKWISELRFPFIKNLYRFVFLLKYSYKIKIKRYIC